MTYLAQIVRVPKCCGSTSEILMVVEVFRLKPAMISKWICPDCSTLVEPGEIMALLTDGTAIELYRLKRLPPRGEAENIEAEKPKTELIEA